MSEIPKGNPQFVGQADARNVRASEVTKPADVKLSPEQQQVADVMKESGEVLEKKIVDAREDAGKKLQGLHGKELVDAGKKQMVRGLVDTAKAQVKWAIGGGIFGAGMGKISERSGFDIPDIVRDSAVGYAALAQGVGPEAAAIKHNRTMEKTGEMSKVKLSDWLISRGSIMGLNTLLYIITPLRNIAYASNFGIAISAITTNLLNPITVRGLRDVMQGSRELKQGVI